MAVQKYIGDRFVGTEFEMSGLNSRNGSIFITVDTELVYLRADNEWLAVAAANIDTLINTNIENLQHENILVFNELTGEWVNRTVMDLLNLYKSLGELSNVNEDADSPTESFIKWNGNEWINSSIVESDISGFKNYALTSALSQYQTRSEKGQPDGYVPLDSEGLIDQQYIPALAITEVFVVANISERNNLVIGNEDGQIQAGDIAIVIDASDDPNLEGGSASYIYANDDGTSEAGWVKLKSPDYVIPGEDTEVIFNKNGDFGADYRFTYDNNLLTLKKGKLKITERQSNVEMETLEKGESDYYVITGAENGRMFTRIMSRMDNRNIIFATHVEGFEEAELMFALSSSSVDSEDPINCVIKSDDLFLAVGDNGTILKSIDGENWEEIESPTEENLNEIIYDEENEEYIAVGDNGTILISEDGENWEEVDSGTDEDLHSITLSDSNVHISGSNGTVLTSSREGGSSSWSWSSSSTGSSSTLFGISSFGSSLYAVGSGGSIYRSTDNGSTWTSVSSGTTNNLYGITSVGNTLYIVGEDGIFLTATSTEEEGEEELEFEIEYLGEDDLIDIVETDSGIIIITENNDIIESENMSKLDDACDSEVNFDVCNMLSKSWLHDVKYDNEKWILFGENGIILTSPDGGQWTAREPNTTNSINSATYNGSGWVAVGDNGTILNSTDGNTWINTMNTHNVNLHGVTWHESFWIAVGDNGTILKSVNGENWDAVSPSVTNVKLNAIKSNGTVLVAVGDEGKILTSLNGDNWNIVDHEEENSLKAIGWNGSLWLTVGDNGTVIGSNDANIWSNINSESSNNLKGILWDDNQWIAVGSFGTILISRTGTVWERLFSTSSKSFSNINFNDDTWVAVGEDGTILVTKFMPVASDNTAETIDSPTTFNLNGIAYDETSSVAVAVGDNGNILFSEDGQNWANVNSMAYANMIFGNNSSPNLLDIKHNGSLWVIVGEHGKVLTSESGTNWNVANSNTSNTLTSIEWNGNLWLAAGNDGTILHSFDGISWEGQNVLQESFNNVLWDGTKWIAVADEGKILSSVDGTNWSVLQTDTSRKLNGIAWNEQLFVIVGDNGVILTSTDGISWNRRSSITSKNLMSVGWNGSFFIAVGSDGTLLESESGNSWSSKNSRVDEDLNAVVWASPSWYIVGNKGTILINRPVEEEDYHFSEDFSEVFNTWTRFSHLDGQRPASTVDLDSWIYDEENDLIISTRNTPTTIGFVSTRKYDNYNFDVVVDSTNSDDDLIGLVLAFAVDELGREHTITVMRTPGGIGHNAQHINGGQRMLFFAYMNIADYQNSEYPSIDLGSNNRGLIWGDTGQVDADRVQTSDVGSWADWDGCRIRAERRGDQFTVMTSQLSEREFVPEATITFNLNDHPELAIFKGPQSIGYTCHSQQDSFFEVLERRWWNV